MRDSFSTDLSRSDFQNSIENYPLPTDKSLVIDRRLESNSDTMHATRIPTHKVSISSNSVSDQSPGPLFPPSPADSTMASASPLRPASRNRRFSVGGAIGLGDAAGDKDNSRGMRNIERGTPGDAATFPDTKTPLQKELAKRKSQYYQDVFGQKEPTTSARDRVSRESIVMADVRTNVIVSSLNPYS